MNTRGMVFTGIGKQREIREVCLVGEFNNFTRKEILGQQEKIVLENKKIILFGKYKYSSFCAYISLKLTPH